MSDAELPALPEPHDPPVFGYTSTDMLAMYAKGRASRDAEVEALRAERDALQAEVDRLQLEYEPDEMNAKQMATWAEFQAAHTEANTDGDAQ